MRQKVRKNKKDKDIIIANERKGNFILFFFVLIYSFFVFSGVTLAEESVDKLLDKDKELKKKGETYEKIIQLKRKEGGILNQKINNLNGEINETNANIKKKEERIRSINEQVMDLGQKITKGMNDINAQKKFLVDVLRSYYETKNQLTAMAIASDTLVSIFLEEDYLGQIGKKVTEVTSNLKIAQEKLNKQKEELIAKKKEHIKEQGELVEKKEDLLLVKTEKRSILIQTQGDEARYKNRLNKIEEKRQAIRREIERLEEQKSSEIDWDNVPSFKSGYLKYPVKSKRVTQRYGKTSFAKSAYKSGKHNGIDFGVSYVKVYAAKSGKVIGKGNSGKYAYGKWLAIDHGDGLVTMYAHLSSRAVSKGDKVKTGEKIGVTGNTGYSTGAHLHFSVFAEGTFDAGRSVSGLPIPIGGSINPENYL